MDDTKAFKQMGALIENRIVFLIILSCVAWRFVICIINLVLVILVLERH